MVAKVTNLSFLVPLFGFITWFISIIHMPEKFTDRTIFSLSEVAASIQKTLAERYTGNYWIKAEMNKVNHYPHSGHCYPDLVEKTDGKIVAEMRSTIWKDDFKRINDGFLKILHEPLKDGIKILFCAKIAYSPVYGLSLRILDIDPSWSLGELEREKQETIARLSEAGIIRLNKSLQMPMLPGRIAIISVQTSKGYADFRKIIDENGWGYGFFYMLFPAILQGENAVPSILGQLEQIKKVKHHFDVVAIIRGGGGDVGLTCYNNYNMAYAIATFPLPVMTGIGHSTNETVAELVAHINAITPTELADYLIQKYHNFSVPLRKSQEIVIEKSTRLLHDETMKITTFLRYFNSVTLSAIARRRSEVTQETKAVQQLSAFFIKRQHESGTNIKNNLFSKSLAFMQGLVKDLAALERQIDLLDPVNVLKRGYSLTMAGGKAIRSVEEIREGALLTTMLADGKITSKVQTVNKIDDNE
jgi:exodeoxyribonuclease VII large subunit